MKELLIILCIFLFHSAKSQIIVTELLASNSSINEDSIFNATADWFEIYNSSNIAIDLQSYYFSDNISNAAKWQFPYSYILQPGEYFLIWADSQDTLNHTNFKLSADGEILLIHDQNGVLIDSLSFPAQKTDISYGRNPQDPLLKGYLEYPTPNTVNAKSFTNILLTKVLFSIKGGFYSNTVSVSLSSDQGDIIRYTTDGSEPNSQSLQYTQAITFDTTTIVRARLFRANHLPGSIVTHSYFINEDFDTHKLPVVSIATNPKNFWDTDSGIYVVPARKSCKPYSV